MLVHRHDRSDLDRLKRAVVEIRLQSCERLHDFGVPDDEADPPARHRKRLGQRVQLDSDLHSPIGLEDRRRHMAVEGEVGVGEIVDDEQFLLAGEVDDALHETGVDHRGRRVVREREQEHARPRARALECLDHVAEQVFLRPHRDPFHDRAGEDRREQVNRIARARHHRSVTGLDEHPHQMCETLLGADRGQRLRLRIELDTEPSRVQAADRPPQVGNSPAGRVAVVARARRGLAQLLDRDRGRGQVRVAEPEVDHVLAGAAQLELQVIDRREDVRR
jgi:hypothetical protein